MNCHNCSEEIPANQAQRITFRLPDGVHVMECLITIMCSTCAEKIKSGELKIIANTCKPMGDGEKLTNEHIVSIEMQEYP